MLCKLVRKSWRYCEKQICTDRFGPKNCGEIAEGILRKAANKVTLQRSWSKQGDPNKLAKPERCDILVSFRSKSLGTVNSFLRPIWEKLIISLNWTIPEKCFFYFLQFFFTLNPTSPPNLLTTPIKVWKLLAFRGYMTSLGPRRDSPGTPRALFNGPETLTQWKSVSLTDQPAYWPG